ncbi:MAG: 3-deoxy-manno-octulosonate cytidylyltransferase [Candidatus Cyclobacteriaceae bacterium M2_1C_046]
MKILGVIPARYASTRFPGKPLADIKGKSMIQRVYEQTGKAKKIDKVIVATDDQRIEDHVKSWGGNVLMTAAEHNSGTDRCMEAYEKNDEAFEYVINIQGDEPFIEPEQIDTLADLLDGKTELATLIKEIDDAADIVNPNVVKVVSGKSRALYFSRSPIPHFRNISIDKWLDQHVYFRHIGIYAYRTDILKQITSLSQGDLEKAESLEQLRWLENGYSIKVAKTSFESIGIDTPEDLERAVKYYK